MSDVFEQFAELEPAVSSTEFQAIPLAGKRDDYLAKGQDGSPVFLLQDEPTGRYHPSLHLRYLNADFQLTCRLHAGNRDMDGVFALICCTADEAELHELFVRSFDAAREQLSEQADTEEIKRTVQNLASLFRAFAKPSQRSISGLWAELFFIVRSGDSIRAIKAWRSDPFERFDFSAPTCAIEVKSTMGQLRTHEFALEQLSVPLGGSLFVISMLLQITNGGTGILELVSNIESTLSNEPPLREKLWKNVIGDLGSDFTSALDKRFDISFAERHCVILRAEDIPRPIITPDSRITNIRFVSNLTDTLSSLSDSSIRGLQSVLKNIE
ncbi:MAG TPA: PD-(D/E)XK motif protein [Terracidiphilus sp.]|nr:PD-(D/E)XK motif protein [Terracidiphilus sp.]